jgi:hypothetical protein
MDISFITAQLDQEWDDGGFLQQLRVGRFDEEGYQRFLGRLEQIDFAEEVSTLPRRIVELLWFVPLFMSWQEERLEEAGNDMKLYNAAFHKILDQIYRILGLP